MTSAPLLNILLVGLSPDAVAAGIEHSDWGPFALTAVADAGAALEARATHSFDAAVIDLDDADIAALLPALGAGFAVIVVSRRADAALLTASIEQGASDLLTLDEASGPAFGLRLRAAIERRRIDRDGRRAWATDLTTGLPHRQQLIEHVSQLIALREREPAPMAVLVFRVEGFATTEIQLGAQAADALRRKIAVRLRATVRASDVVAALDDESYGVLLGSLLAPTDAERVAAKLARALSQPFSVGGVGVAVAAAIGMALFPADGDDADVLLRKAVGMALDEPAQGRIGMANFHETGMQPLGAANDD